MTQVDDRRSAFSAGSEAAMNPRSASKKTCVTARSTPGNRAKKADRIAVATRATDTGEAVSTPAAHDNLSR